MSNDGEKSGESTVIPSFGLPHVRYPNEYVWFVLFSSMDILLTWAILKNGGSEVNPIAQRVIATWGLNGAIGFKFGLTIFVIVICEFIARRRVGTGRMLARLAVIVSAAPVVYSLVLLFLQVSRAT
jgi:hypothetical protein